MRKLILLLFIFTLSFSHSKAGHTAGGEISWECLSNGKYIFKARLYIRCQNAGYPFQNQTLYVNGSPLPRDSANNPISQIILKPDSNKWYNSGDLSLQCDTNSNFQMSCLGISPLQSAQQFIFASDPIELNGIAPLSGWSFSFELPCCRGNYSNLTIRGSQMIRSTLYQHNGNKCLDNSPVFTQPPNFTYYGNESYKINEGVMDFDNDSLAYAFDYTYNSPASAPQIVPFVTTYNFSPNSMGSFITYDSTNGDLFLKDTMNNNQIYFVRMVQSFRNGQLISETYRESPLFFELSINVNDKPKISPPFYKGGATYSFKDTITAGSLININLNVIDTNTVNGNPQEITIQVISENISQDYTVNGACTNPKDTNCAYIPLSNATYNAQRDAYEMRRTSLYNGQIRWQTDCSDLSNSGGAKTHYFVVRVQDDLCPIPGLTYETIEVTVVPPAGNPCPLTTSVENRISLEEQLNVYPNPTNGQLTISSSINEELSLKIFNLQGQLVQEEILLNSSNQFNLKGEKGLYFIRITNQNGEQANLKIIKN